MIVTSPPYPLVEMWDEIFALQDGRIGEQLSRGNGRGCFRTHARAARCGLAGVQPRHEAGGHCLHQHWRRHPNLWMATSSYTPITPASSAASSAKSLAALPDILWRKQTNAPNKFMGSGMLPVGAYVTYEHEYILVLRKGRRRTFTTAAEKAKRRESAFFWEERNVWFSDVWLDVKGTSQGLVDAPTRERSAAFPFELAYRLICMFSVKEDWVLDPFAGTGTTLAAALTAGRNSVGCGD